MKLYKFRSLSNLQHVYDIFLSNRLHCADVRSFNDPFEGYCNLKYLIGVNRFVRKEGGVIIGTTAGAWGDFKHNDQRVSPFRDELYSNKVCALSNDLNNILLWSHYADAHSGVSIEIEIPDEQIALVKDLPREDEFETSFSFNKSIYEVEYIETFPQALDGDDSKIKRHQTYRVLIRKLSSWRYEGEFRIIQDTKYFNLPNQIKNVFCGCNMDDVTLKQMKDLFPNINFYRSTQIYEKPWIKF